MYMDYKTSLYNKEQLQHLYFLNYKSLVTNMLNIISKLNIPLYGEYALKDYYDIPTLKKTLPIQIIVTNEDLHIRLLREIFGKDSMNYFDDYGKSTIFIKKGDIINQQALKVPLLQYNRIYKQHLALPQYQVRQQYNKLNMRYIAPIYCLIDVLYKLVNSIDNMDDWVFNYKLYNAVLVKMNIKPRANNNTLKGGNSLPSLLTAKSINILPPLLTVKSDNILYDIYQSCIKDKDGLLTGDVISDFFLGTSTNVEQLMVVIYPGSTLLSELNAKYDKRINITESKIHHFIIQAKYLIEIDKRLVMNIYSINSPISYITPNIPNIYGHILCILMINFIVKRNNNHDQLNIVKKLMAIEPNIDKNDKYSIFQSNALPSFFDYNCSTLYK